MLCYTMLCYTIQFCIAQYKRPVLSIIHILVYTQELEEKRQAEKLEKLSPAEQARLAVSAYHTIPYHTIPYHALQDLEEKRRQRRQQKKGTIIMAK